MAIEQLDQLIFSGILLATAAVGLYAAHREVKDQEKTEKKRKEKQRELDKILSNGQFTKQEAAIARLYQRATSYEKYDVAMKMGLTPERYDEITDIVDKYTK